ncbi:MAG: hypothetical protein ACTSWX_12580 [Promethearchaeota archaeon]
MPNVNSDYFFVSNLRMKIERKKEIYNPNLISHLSTDEYNDYLIKFRIYNEILEILEKEDMNQSHFEEFINKKLSKIQSEIKNTKNENELKKFKVMLDEYKNLL